MDLSKITPAKGARKKNKRVGRGPGSGHGKTACRGSKGQLARTGKGVRAWFEGGQMPLQRRIPKRGFRPLEVRRYEIVNLGELNRIKESKIGPEALIKARLIRKSGKPIKVLADGELEKAVEISAHAFSKGAVEKIEAAGGKAIRL